MNPYTHTHPCRKNLNNKTLSIILHKIYAGQKASNHHLWIQVQNSYSVVLVFSTLPFINEE